MKVQAVQATPAPPQPPPGVSDTPKARETPPAPPPQNLSSHGVGGSVNHSG
jgi:hypothetical protein